VHLEPLAQMLITKVISYYRVFLDIFIVIELLKCLTNSPLYGVRRSLTGLHVSIALNLGYICLFQSTFSRYFFIIIV
jgi:hypothetical protein